MRLAATAPAAAPTLTSAPYAFPLTLHWTPAERPAQHLAVGLPGDRALHDPARCRRADRDLPGQLDHGLHRQARRRHLLLPHQGRGSADDRRRAGRDRLGRHDQPDARPSSSPASPRRASSAAPSESRARAPTRSPEWPRASSTPGRPGRALPARCSRQPGTRPRWPTAPTRSATWSPTTRGTVRPQGSRVIDRQPRAARPRRAVAAPPGQQRAAAFRPGRAEGAHEAQGRRSRVKRHRTGIVPVRLRWVNPAAADLDRVVAVLNKRAIAARAGRRARDLPGARRVGRAPAARRTARARRPVRLRSQRQRLAGGEGAGDPGRARPPAAVDGSVLRAAPRLRWKPHRGTAYYNLQLFHNGRRVLVAWPSRTFYRPVRHAGGRHVRLVRVAGGQAQGRIAHVRRADRPRDVRRQAVGTTARTGRSMPGIPARRGLTGRSARPRRDVLLGAALACARAARVEAAAAREARGVGHLALEDRRAAPGPRAGARRDGDERLRVGVLRALEHVGGGAELDHAARGT